MFPKNRSGSDGTAQAGPDRTGQAAADGEQGAGTLRATMGEPFTHVLRVRYGECDPQGVVFNANYFAYFDVALTELWRAAVGPYTDMMAAGVDMVVAEARARYLAPAGFDDELAIDVRISSLGTTSMVTRMTVRRGAASGQPADEIVAEGEMRHVFIDARTKRKIAVPEDYRRGFGRYLAQESEAWSTSA